MGTSSSATEALKQISQEDQSMTQGIPRRRRATARWWAGMQRRLGELLEAER